MNLKLKLETKKQKIIALILAIVSIILCVAIVLLTVASCNGGEATGGKTVQKVIKKKVIIVKKPDTEDDEDENTYYDVVDDDYDGPEEVVDTVIVPEEPEYEVELGGKIDTPLSDKIALAFYHYSPGDWTKQFGEKYGKEGDILSCCSVGNIEQAKLCKEYGMGGWIVPYKGTDSFVDGTTELTENWKDTLTSTVEAYKVMGLWDVIEGFHFDEPMGYLSGEQFRSMTKFLAESFPNKRIYAVFSTYELDGYSPSRTFDKVDYYNSAFLTDAGFDAYSTLDIEVQRERFKQMSEQIGRKNVRLWVYPATFRYTANTTEDFCIANLNMHYELLKEFENPGGIHMYTWTTYGNQTGFRDLNDPSLNWNFTRLLERILEISKEMKTMKYTYTITKN